MDKQEKVNKIMAKARKVRLTNLANKGKDTYLNLKWMQQRYVIERKSLDTIAELANVDYETIWFALEKLKIPNRLLVEEDEIDRYKAMVLSKLKK